MLTLPTALLAPEKIRFVNYTTESLVLLIEPTTYLCLHRLLRLEEMFDSPPLSVASTVVGPLHGTDDLWRQR